MIIYTDAAGGKHNAGCALLVDPSDEIRPKIIHGEFPGEFLDRLEGGEQLINQTEQVMPLVAVGC